EADKRCRQTGAEMALASNGCRDLRQIGVFVLRHVVPAELNAPDLLVGLLIPDRLEGNRGLHDVSLLESAGLDVPDRIPVESGDTLVRNLAVDAPSGGTDF